jgi:transglutaminase-like putative cysteine protease
MIRLHRRLSALLSLIALITFISGAGLDAPAVIPAAGMLLIAVFFQPNERTTRFLEPWWRGAAVLLALRAVLHVFSNSGDPVLPMVDLLLLLLCAESLRQRDGSGDARHFALTFALLIASAAYRPGALFGLLFIAYVVCATVVLVVGHLTRQAAARNVAPPQPERSFLLRIAALSSVVLLVSASVFLFFPRVSQGWAARGTPLMSRAVIGFSDQVSIGAHGARLEANPEVVLRVEFPNGAPPNPGLLHWRGRSYNHFDGRTWSRREYRLSGVNERASVVNEAARWPGALIEQVVYARPLGNANVLFGLHPVLDISSITRIRPRRLPSGDFLYDGEAEPAYRVRSRAEQPHPDSLRAVTITGEPQVLAHSQFPRITERTQALADSFARAAPNMYDHALAVQQWLQTQFRYTLDLPATRAQTSLDYFLFERRAGHCEYFSTAMAILLRAAGVPTRNVNGFLGGTWNEFGQFLTVTQNNAHSWVEVYFPGYGWVPFDPTPSGSGAGGTAVTRRFSTLRAFFDGVEHRWGKWVLDYDLNKQRDLMERATAALERNDDGEGTVANDSQQRYPWRLAIAAAFVIALIITVRRMRAHGHARHALVTRAYVTLRRAYERAGHASAHMPPLAFADAVSRAPGGTDAQQAVALYVRERFGGMALSEAERAELKRRVAAAQRAVARTKPRKRGSG